MLIGKIFVEWMLGGSMILDVLLMHADKCKSCRVFKHLQQQKSLHQLCPLKLSGILERWSLN